VSARTPPPSGTAGVAFALTSSACHAALMVTGPGKNCTYGHFRAQ
jgi:hypothetical protein